MNNKELKEQFLSYARKNRKIEKVELPGLTFWITELSTREWVKVNELKGEKQIAMVVAKSVCDEGGNLLCTEEDADAILEFTPVAFNKIFDAAMKLGGQGEKAADDVEKKS